MADKNSEVPKWFWKLAASALVSAAITMGYGGFAIGEFKGTANSNQASTEKHLSQIDERLGKIEANLYPSPQYTIND